MVKNLKALLLLLVILAVIVRLIIAFNTCVVSSDGPLYIEAANYYYQGDFKSGFNHPYHPLYPFLMSLLYRVIGNWEWAGFLISIILSSCAVIPLYLIGLQLFDNKIALIASLFYVFEPNIARISSGILTTGTFICLLVFAVYYFMKAMEQWKYLYFALSGLFALLAFLTRPDGLIIIGIFALWILFANISGWWKGEFKRKLLALVCLILPWLVIAIPYIAYVTIKAGSFNISHKLTAVKLSVFLNPLINPKALYIVAEDLLKSSHPVLLLLVILGVLLRKKFLLLPSVLSSKWIIWSLVIGYIIVLVKFADVFGRISKRYTTPLMVLAIFWGAVGLYILIGKFSKYNIKWITIASVIMIIILGISTFNPVGKDRLVEKQAGEWIRTYHKGMDKPVIVADSNRVPYYGGGKIIMNYEGTRLKRFGKDYKTVLANLRGINTSYLVIDLMDDDVIIPGFTKQLQQSDLEYLFTASDKGRALTIYKVK